MYVWNLYFDKDVNNNSKFLIPIKNCQRLSRRADERVEVRKTSCPYDGKLYLKADEPQVGQQHEDVERKLEYYHIIVFPERT